MLQRSPEWFAIRLGKATGSRIFEIMARTKSGPAASRENYKIELACERQTGMVKQSYQNGAMLQGIEREPQARAEYELDHGSVEEVGFVEHPTIAMAGCSPDGLIGEDGALEIKCPEQAQHHRTRKGKNIEAKYLYQIQWLLACTGRKWCDFVSFNPDFPPEKQLVVRRVNRDDKLIAELEKEVVAFLAEVEEEAVA